MIFLAHHRIHFSRVLTLAFIPSLFQDEGHCLYVEKDFLLFHPCFSSHPPHQGMSQTIWHLGGEGGERLRGNWEEGRDEDRRREWRWDNQYLGETWEEAARPCFHDIQDALLKTAIKSIKAHGAGVLGVQGRATWLQIAELLLTYLVHNGLSYTLSWNTIT